MVPIPYFSIDVPRIGERINGIEFGWGKLKPVGPFVSVKGPFRFSPHNTYECTTPDGEEAVIYHLQPGETMDAEAATAFENLNAAR